MRLVLLSQRDCKPRRYVTIRDWDQTPSFIATRGHLRGGAHPLHPPPRSAPGSCACVSRAVTLQRKIRDCSQSSLTTSRPHEFFKSDEKVYGKSRSLFFGSQYTRYKKLIRVRKHSIILLQIKNYQCYEFV